MSRKTEKALAAAETLIGSGFQRKFGGRRIICIGPKNAAVAEFFGRWGASHVLNLSTVRKQRTSVSDELNGLQRTLIEPPKHLAQELRTIDPDGSGLIYAGSFVRDDPCLGRNMIGARRAEWFQSEDKAFQIFWTQDQPNFRQEWIPNPTVEDLEKASRRTNAGLTVLSGAPLGGLALGGSHTFAVPINNDALSPRGRRVVGRLVQQCRGVRVSPLTAGRPVTYYGYIAGGRWLAFGPVEALALWNRASLRIEALGILTPWLDAEPAFQSRSLIDSVLKRLTSGCAYSGAFCVDGVVGAGGLIVHEVNTRVCAGFRLFNNYVAGFLPANVVDLVLREGLVEDIALLFQCLDDIYANAMSSPHLELWSDPRSKSELVGGAPTTLSSPELYLWRDKVLNHLSSRTRIPLALL